MLSKLSRHCHIMSISRLNDEHNEFCFQGIIPSSANDKVTELFVKPEVRDAVVAEAETLPSLDISTLDMEWLQVLSEGWASPMKG